MAHRLRPRPPVRKTRPEAGGRLMASSPDDLRVQIEAYPWPARRGGVEVVRANKSYTLYSLRTGGPVARLRPTGQGEKVQVLWWRREAWGNPGPLRPRGHAARQSPPVHRHRGLLLDPCFMRPSQHVQSQAEDLNDLGSPVHPCRWRMERSAVRLLCGASRVASGAVKIGDDQRWEP